MLGLVHSYGAGDIMGPYYEAERVEPSEADAKAVAELYVDAS